MPSKNPSQRLRDIVDNVDVIASFVVGIDGDEFARDQKTMYAVVRGLEIISKASRRLPDDLKARHRGIDWAVAAAGNVYRHEYEGVDADLIWRTVQHDLQMLRDVAASELEFLNRES
jgi:uncharacterized protein with HEPN domain